MNAMLAHSKDVKMQRLGCQAVGASAAGQSDQRLCGELLLVGAHQSVMAAMSTHPDDVEIHYNGCRALKWFTQRGSSEQCRLLLSAGVLMQMLQALQRHGSHPGASEEALTAMVRMLQMSVDDGQVPVHERILIFENRKWLLQLGASHAAQFAFIAIMLAFSPSPITADPMITGENGAGIEHVRAASATMQARSIKTWSGVVMGAAALALAERKPCLSLLDVVTFGTAINLWHVLESFRRGVKLPHCITDRLLEGVESMISFAVTADSLAVSGTLPGHHLDPLVATTRWFSGQTTEMTTETL